MNRQIFLFLALLLAQDIYAKKPHTFMVFMERNNELDPFGELNIKQMQTVGSNKNINIIVYMHCREKKTKKSKVLFIKKNTATILKETPEDKKFFSIKKELVNFCNEIIKNYPADHYSLVFWDHASGVKEPQTKDTASNIFSFSKQYHHTQHTSHLLSNIKKNRRKTVKGVCFDDSEGTFLSEKQMKDALAEICATSLNNKKFDIIGFDACLMSMIEVGSAIKDYAKIMVGSQEVELGTGWNYARTLAPFLYGSISPKALSKHIVQSYAKTYQTTADYTQSATNLNLITDLEENVAEVAKSLFQLIKKQNQKAVLAAIKISRNKHYCTHFDEPDFIDLRHFYQNLLENTSQIKLSNEGSQNLLSSLKDKLCAGKSLIQKIVLFNKTGRERPQASGLSIYFPEENIHKSYHKSSFTLSNPAWTNFLQSYLSR